MNCAFCLKEIKKSQSELNKKRNNYFCGVACYYLFQRKRVDKICEICGNKFKVILVRHLKGHGRTCSRKCHYIYQSIRPQIIGENHHCYKGGRSNNNGYIEIRKSSKERYKEHRLIMEKYLGVKIPKMFVVHHIDKNRKNNDIKNLCLVTSSGHSKLHYLMGDYKKKRITLEKANA